MLNPIICEIQISICYPPTPFTYQTVFPWPCPTTDQMLRRTRPQLFVIQHQTCLGILKQFFGTQLLICHSAILRRICQLLPQQVSGIQHQTCQSRRRQNSGIQHQICQLCQILFQFHPPSLTAYIIGTHWIRWPTIVVKSASPQ